MKVRIIPVTPMEQNCSLAWCEATRQAVVIDPGGDVNDILAAITEEAVELSAILLTHGHVDHAGGTAELARHTGTSVLGPHVEDRFWIQGIPMQAKMFGLPPAEAFEPTAWLSDGETVRFGEQTLEVLHCPGHTPGHIVFFHPTERIAFVGDVLFQGSIGRTDFPRGDYATLIRSITQRLWPLGDDVTFIPGHGPNSTFGHERRTNPFVGDLR